MPSQVMLTHAMYSASAELSATQCEAIVFQIDASSEVIVRAAKVHFTIAQVFNTKTGQTQLSNGKVRRTN